MAALKKEKETPKKGKIKRAIKEEEHVVRPQESESRWQAQIDRLRERSFSSTDEVISAIVTEVTSAMGLGDDDDTRRFIRDTILTDPLMNHRLQSFVKTK